MILLRLQASAQYSLAMSNAVSPQFNSDEFFVCLSNSA